MVFNHARCAMFYLIWTYKEESDKIGWYYWFYFINKRLWLKNLLYYSKHTLSDRLITPLWFWARIARSQFCSLIRFCLFCYTFYLSAWVIGPWYACRNVWCYVINITIFYITCHVSCVCHCHKHVIHYTHMLEEKLTFCDNHTYKKGANCK